jgi:hypothetical protein
MFGKVIRNVSRKLKWGLYLGTNFIFVRVLIFRNRWSTIYISINKNGEYFTSIIRIIEKNSFHKPNRMYFNACTIKIK